MFECNTRLVYVHLWDFIISCSKKKSSKYKHVSSLRREIFLSSCRNLHDHGVPNSSLRSHSKSAVSPKRKFNALNHLVWTWMNTANSRVEFRQIYMHREATYNSLIGKPRSRRRRVLKLLLGEQIEDINWIEMDHYAAYCRAFYCDDDQSSSSVTTGY